MGNEREVVCIGCVDWRDASAPSPRTSAEDGKRCELRMKKGSLNMTETLDGIIEGESVVEYRHETALRESTTAKSFL